jgi:hypothetical protein
MSRMSDSEARNRRPALRKWRGPLGVLLALLVTGVGYVWQLDHRARSAAIAFCERVRALPPDTPLAPLIQSSGASKVLQHSQLLAQMPEAGTPDPQQDLVILEFHGFRRWTRHECLVSVRPGRPYAVEVRHTRTPWLPFAPDKF